MLISIVTFSIFVFENSAEKMAAQISHMVADHGYTNTARALAHAAQYMFQGERDHARKVVILITDGL